MLSSSQEQDAIARIRAILAGRMGEGRAITLDALTQEAGLANRRQAEQLLETHLGEFGFALVSGSRGYYRPSSPDELNHYLASLRSRIRCIAIRHSTVRRSAAREGFTYDGRHFTSQPAQLELAISTS